MNRRSFCKNTALSSGAIVLSSNIFPSTIAEQPFNMKFSPDFGIFEAASGEGLIDQIKWGYDQGFRAWESTMLKFKSVAEQENINKTLKDLGMEFGQFVGTLTFEDITFAGNDKALRNQVLEDVKRSVEIAQRMDTRVVHNVLGVADPKLPYEYQLANAIDLLKRIADIYEPHGITMVMESMNSKIDHPGMFLRTIPQAYVLARAVDRASVKILFDFYHIQIEEGNILPTLDFVWDEIGYIQVGDTPGRNEPTSGEINFWNCLQHVHDKGYRGFVGLEHGTSVEGEAGAMKAVEAYRQIDPK